MRQRFVAFFAIFLALFASAIELLASDQPHHEAPRVSFNAKFSYPGGVAEFWLEKRSPEIPSVRYGLSEPAILDEGDHWRVLIGLNLDRLPGDYVIYTRQEDNAQSSHFIEFQVAHRNYSLFDSLGTDDSSQIQSSLPVYDELSELDFNNSQPPGLPLRLPSESVLSDNVWSNNFGQQILINGQDTVAAQNHSYALLPPHTLIKAPQSAIVSKIVTHENGISDIALDHGRGIYSILYGLSDLSVELGNGVVAGAVLGKVPNKENRSNTEQPSKALDKRVVYWQVQLNNVLVDPLVMTRLRPNRATVE